MLSTVGPVPATKLLDLATARERHGIEPDQSRNRLFPEGLPPQYWEGMANALIAALSLDETSPRTDVSALRSALQGRAALLWYRGTEGSQRQAMGLFTTEELLSLAETFRTAKESPEVEAASWMLPQGLPPIFSEGYASGVKLTQLLANGVHKGAAFQRGLASLAIRAASAWVRASGALS